MLHSLILILGSSQLFEQVEWDIINIISWTRLPNLHHLIFFLTLLLQRLLDSFNHKFSKEESICNILNQFNHQESERSSSACSRTHFLFLCSSLQNTSWWPEHTSNSSTWFKRKYNNLNVRHLNDIVIVVLFKNTTNEQCTTHVYLQNKTDKSKNHSGNGAVHKFCPKI